MPEKTDPSVARGGHRAGLFDIRTIIGVLVGVYGIVLIIVSFVNTSKQVDKADGVNINLWAGIGLLVAGLVFVTWARLRPIVVPEEGEGEERPPAH